MNDFKAYKITIIGQVQMVGFRNFVKSLSELLMIRGTVENVLNNVVVIAEGYESDIEVFMKALTYGSPMSFVEELHIEPLKYSGSFLKMTIIYPPPPKVPINYSWKPEDWKPAWWNY